MPEAGPLGPASVVVFGLLSAVCFGSADFGGGSLGRRAPVLGISLVVQLVGAVITVALAVAVAEALPDAPTIALAAVAGMVGVIGILALYRGLAVGRMGVVAPVTGVLGAALPVSVGFVLEGPPAPSASVGIALAIVAVVVVSRASGAEGGRSGIEHALVAGTGIGLFNALIGQLPEGHVWWPLTVVKLSAGLLICLVIVASRPAWRLPRPVMPLAAAVAIGDMSGNALYVLAAQTGRLDVAAVLSGLYPVVTVVLAPSC